MGIIFGYLAVICFILLVAKAVTRQQNLQQFDLILKKFHRTLSTLLVILCILHVICVMPYSGSMLVNMTGKLTMLAILAIIALAYIIKDKRKNILWHKILTAIVMVGTIAHIVVSMMN